MTLHEHRWAPEASAFHRDLVQAIFAREAHDPGVQVSNVGGWHSTPDLLDWDDPAIVPLTERILEGVARFDTGATRMQAWATVMRRGAYHLAHRHGAAYWSGVYYLDPGNEGCGGRITFAQGETHRTIAPAEGLLLLFPGDLLHSVEVYTGERPRVAVAFNLAIFA